jgi:hypothetical protein
MWWEILKSFWILRWTKQGLCDEWERRDIECLEKNIIATYQKKKRNSWIACMCCRADPTRVPRRPSPQGARMLVHLCRYCRSNRCGGRARHAMPCHATAPAVRSRLSLIPFAAASPTPCITLRTCALHMHDACVPCRLLFSHSLPLRPLRYSSSRHQSIVACRPDLASLSLFSPVYYF